ncbi:MAG: LysM peptidoglycan-binding domain-containing protein [Flavobacteriales bacterium]|nr:LysM peptidoglycan-binding domain-containing protein [Flavobacteriales bacterium]
MNCPVCKKQEVSRDAKNCSSCDSDLSAFVHILQVEKQRRTYKTVILILAVLLFAGGGTLAALHSMHDPSSHSQLQVEETKLDSSNFVIENLQNTLQERNEEIQSLKEEAHALLATMESSQDDVEEGDHTVHIVQEGETLWSISEMYHGHGFKHEEIAGHNEVNNMHHIEVGDTIIVKH